MKGAFYGKKITIGGRTFEQGRVYANPYASAFSKMNHSTMIFEVRDIVDLSDGLKYHIENEIPLHRNIYRAGSSEYLKLFKECRTLVNENKLAIFDDYDKWFVESDIGEVGRYEGKSVLLDFPHTVSEELRSKPLSEAEYQGKEVELNKPSRSSGPKKYQVYVTNDKGNVIKVNFGDEKGGLSSKINDPDARKAFADRHNCSDKKDKTKAGYWSCNLPKYADQLGLSGGGNFYW